MMNARARLLASTLLVGAAAFAVPAQAQVTTQDQAVANPESVQSPQTAASDDQTVDGGEIIVTGSLIQNPNLVASNPVNVVTEQELGLRQTANVETLLRELPGVVPSIGSAVNNGNGGASFVNLRGLGSNRNLVLLDGQRLVPSGFGGQVDLNNIPVALIQRVDVLTGGASTTYGADAVTGVVNFITRTDFTGVEIQAQQGITERGDGNNFRFDLTTGASFDDGRGNVVLSVGYQEADPVYQGGRPFSLQQISSTTGVSGGGSATGTPAAVELNDGSFFQVSPDGNSLQPFYNAFNFNPFNIFQTPFERFNIYGQANYELTDNVEIYSRGLFSKNTVQTIIAPSGVFGEQLNIGLNNPFLTTGIRNQLCADNGIAAAACTPTSTATVSLPAVYRRTTEVGPRISEYTTTLFDYRIGLRLGITETLNLDVSGSYGESENRETRQNYVLRSRLQQGLNLNAAGTACTDASNGCVPLNLLGPQNSITPEQANFIRGVSTITNFATLAQARALLNGDFGVTSPFASDPISFAVGGEYRDYGARRVPDNLALVPGELGGAGGAILPVDGGFDVYEAVGEVFVPIASDRPFFNQLSLEGGLRYSKYSVNAPGNPEFDAYTYKGGLTFAPVEALKLRGTYARAVRAPNIGELFAPVSTGLDNLATDPCAGAGTLTNANLRAVCLAQAATPAAQARVNAGTVPQPTAGQINVTGGGNPNIQPEKADTYTVGLVIQPREFLPGFSASVDYYNITVNNAIASATPGDIIDACFGTLSGASATSPACTAIRRNPVNGGLSGSSATNPGLPQPLTNNGRYKTDGIDVVVNYTREIAGVNLGLSFNGNWTNASKFRASDSALERDCVGLYSVNCGIGNITGSIQPEFSFNQRTTLGFEGVDLSLLWRYLDAVRAENQTFFNGTITGAGPLVGRSFNFNRIEAYHYFDLSARIQASDAVTFILTAQNLTDKKPPVVGNTIGSTTFNSGNTYPSTYDALGRRYSVQARFRF
jgi:outer membrane receptor protein involved in Fe transport